jgi:hypothetical protein
MKSISDGGFMSSEVFVPKIVWYQQGAKFSGVNVKTTAFNMIINAISQEVEPLYLALDEISLNLANQGVFYCWCVAVCRCVCVLVFTIRFAIRLLSTLQLICKYYLIAS